jgi:hypothetical protein
MNLTINEHCTTISNQRRTISTEQVKSLFDLILLELNKSNDSTPDDYYKIINTLKTLSGLIINHELFSFLQNLLIDLLNKWLNENDQTH